MDDGIKRELIANGAPALVVPAVRAYLNHHFTMKQMEREEQMAVEVAERRQKGIREMARVKGDGAAVGPVKRTEPVGGDVYDELESLRSETGCGFCHNVIDSLMDAPPDEARRGYDELRSYVRETERIKDRGLTEEEAKEIVSDLVDRWEVVPRHTAGMA